MQPGYPKNPARFDGFKFRVSVLQRTARINRKLSKNKATKSETAVCVAAFTARVLCTKIRSRLSDATLDTLCFLRNYYRK